VNSDFTTNNVISINRAGVHLADEPKSEVDGSADVESPESASEGPHCFELFEGGLQI
jgi:hypothetical protein